MRKVTGLFNAPRPHWVGDGFPVRSLISPGGSIADLSPFLMFDYAGPMAFPAATRARGVGEHPHRGFETVTIVYQGELEHRDSAGNGGSIGPGDVQWMTAASGVLHEEFHSKSFTESGGVFEAVQLWVNLPAKDKKAAPGYQTLLSGDIPTVSLPNDAGAVRVIAGAFGDAKGPAKTFTPVNIWDVRLGRDKEAVLSVPEGHTVAFAVLKGTVQVNDEHVARDAQLIVFDRTGGDIKIEANNDATIMVLTGEPINEPVVAHGPFVMNTVGEIKQAMLDYDQGRFGAMT